MLDDLNRKLLAAGRFVEKKAPHLTILAFQQLHRERPDARLRMIGDGPLLGACQDLVQAFGLGEAVTFLGARPHDEVREEMRLASCFGVAVDVIEPTGFVMSDRKLRRAGLARERATLAARTGASRELAQRANAHLIGATFTQMATATNRFAVRTVNSRAQLTQALRGLLAVSEAYPDLKASANFIALQEELSSTENKIGFARQYYNDNVRSLNESIRTFPGNVFAGWAGVAAREFYEVDDPGKRAVPSVSF